MRIFHILFELKLRVKNIFFKQWKAQKHIKILGYLLDLNFSSSLVRLIFQLTLPMCIFETVAKFLRVSGKTTFMTKLCVLKCY